MKVPLPYVNIYEKRLLPRYVTFLPIELYKKINDKKDKSPISIKIINLSKNGVSFCAKEELKPSQELDFKILDNSSLLIEGSGKIIWHKHIKNDNSYLYGFQFIRLRKRDDNKLKELLKSISINSTDKAPIKFESQPYGMMCREMYGVDLSIGCKYKCLYCHFSRLKADQDPNHAGEL